MKRQRTMVNSIGWLLLSFKNYVWQQRRLTRKRPLCGDWEDNTSKYSREKAHLESSLSAIFYHGSVIVSLRKQISHMTTRLLGCSIYSTILSPGYGGNVSWGHLFSRALLDLLQNTLVGLDTTSYPFPKKDIHGHAGILSRRRPLFPFHKRRWSCRCTREN